MKKEYRIKKNDHFQHIIDTGNSFANREFVIYYKENLEQSHFRVGISVGKKLGNAVVRNKIKRYIREVFRNLEDDIIPTVDLIIIARKPALNLKFKQYKKSILHLLHKVHLLR